MYRFGWIIAQILKLFYPLKIFNRKNFIKKGRCVGICNHYTNTDVPLVASSFYRKFNFLAKKELFDTKGKAWLYSHIGGIPLNRENMDLSTLKAALKVLKDEQLLMLFPEGTRNKESLDVQNVKAGAGLFAVKGKAPIIPMALYMPPKIFTKNYLYVGQPMDFSSYYDRKLSPSDMEEIGEIIYDSLRSTREELVRLVESKKKKGKQKINDNDR